MGKKTWLSNVKNVFKSPVKEDRRNGSPHHSVGENEAAESVSIEHFLTETSPDVAKEEVYSNAISSRREIERKRDKIIDKSGNRVGLRTRRTRGQRRRPSREETAAVIIQSYYRGHLARRALRALRGLVRLQALVRGHQVRKVALKTMCCMQSLIRVQARVRANRMNHLMHHKYNNNNVNIDDELIMASPNHYDYGSNMHFTYDDMIKQTRALHCKLDHQTSPIKMKHTVRHDRPNTNCQPIEHNKSNEESWKWLERWMVDQPASPLVNPRVDDLDEKTVEIDPGRTSPMNTNFILNRSKNNVTPSYMTTTHSARGKVRASSPMKNTTSRRYGGCKNNSGDMSNSCGTFRNNPVARSPSPSFPT